MNFMMTDVPKHIQKEMEKLQEVLSPLLVKVSKYSLWMFPLIGISLFNLLFLVFFVPINQNTAPIILLFAVLGAVGMALLKEVKLHQKEIHQLSRQYMIERIKNSEIATDQHKTEYIQLIKGQSLTQIYNTFIQFLKEEDRRRKMIY